jgi:hypothetical protein
MVRIHHPGIYLNPCWTHLYPPPLQPFRVMSSRCGDGAFLKSLPPARGCGDWRVEERRGACSSPWLPGCRPRALTLELALGPWAGQATSRTLGVSSACLGFLGSLRAAQRCHSHWRETSGQKAPSTRKCPQIKAVLGLRDLCVLWLPVSSLRELCSGSSSLFYLLE